MRLRPLPGHFTVTRLRPSDPVPTAAFDAARDGRFVSVTLTDVELSVVAPTDLDLGGERDGPWVAWYLVGPVPFEQTGVVRSVVAPLSDQGCPVFVVSTFDSDVLLVPADRLDLARAALTDAGHELIDEQGR